MLDTFRCYTASLSIAFFRDLPIQKLFRLLIGLLLLISFYIRWHIIYLGTATLIHETELNNDCKYLKKIIVNFLNCAF